MRKVKLFGLVAAGAMLLAACSSDNGASAALAAAESKLAEAETKLASLTTQHAAMMAHDAEIAAVRTFIEIWNSAEVDKLDAIVHSNYQRTAPDLNASSLDELKAFMLQVHAAYPDYKITNDGMAAGPDGVFVQWTVTGSDTGRGEEATGNSLRVTGISHSQFVEGKIASELVIFDTGAVMTQLETDKMPHAAD